VEGKWERRVAHRLKRDTKDNMQQRRQYKEIKNYLPEVAGVFYCNAALYHCPSPSMYENRYYYSSVQRGEVLQTGQCLFSSMEYSQVPPPRNFCRKSWIQTGTV
jgi:hypothetical protein